jgi:hypothetical protein
MTFITTIHVDIPVSWSVIVLLTPNYTIQTYGNSADYKTKSTNYFNNYYIQHSVFLYYNQQVKQDQWNYDYLLFNYLFIHLFTPGLWNVLIIQCQK